MRTDLYGALTVSFWVPATFCVLLILSGGDLKAQRIFGFHVRFRSVRMHLYNSYTYERRVQKQNYFLPPSALKLTTTATCCQRNDVFGCVEWNTQFCFSTELEKRTRCMCCCFNLIGQIHSHLQTNSNPLLTGIILGDNQFPLVALRLRTFVSTAISPSRWIQ